jgi:uncharacterized membrane protein YcaP (DUF421 family)
MAVISGNDFWESEDILRPVTVGLIGYLFLYAAFKILGAGTLAQTTAIGLIVKVTLGSTLATLFLQDTVNLTKTLFAFCVLFFVDIIISLLLSLFPSLTSIVRDDPVLIYCDGKWQRHAMLKSRVNKVDIDAAMRQQGKASFKKVHAIILEITGKYSIVMQDAADDGVRDALESVKNYPPPCPRLPSENSQGDNSRVQAGSV